MKAQEVTLDRLTTTDAKGKRVQVFPQLLDRGVWKRRRELVQWSLIALYLALPWIRVQGHPALLIDFEHRRFSILGRLFFAHEVPTVVFASLSFFLLIGLVTVLFGRAWCGWACPQTVFIDQIFRRIEAWIEGDHLARRRLHAAPMSGDKLLKRVLKWSAFTAVTVVLTHSFLAYFVGSENVLRMMSSSPLSHPGAFTAALVMSGIVLFDFGWFREQFCVVFCPYGRFQSVLMDEPSKIVGYDTNRASDCIDCGKCVTVCPAGIDIRNGLQIECTACTACIDACTPVMQKLKRPEGLIRYTSLSELQGKPSKLMRPRAMVYAAMLAVSSGAFAWRLAVRAPHEIEVVRAVDAPYQLLRDPSGDSSLDLVINHFNLRFHNMDWNAEEFSFALDPESVRAGFELIAAERAIGSASGEHAGAQFFLKFPASLGHAPRARLQFVSRLSGATYTREVNALGPRRDL